MNKISLLEYYKSNKTNAITVEHISRNLRKFMLSEIGGNPYRVFKCLIEEHDVELAIEYCSLFGDLNVEIQNDHKSIICEFNIKKSNILED